MAWYDDIEDEIMIRDEWKHQRTSLEPIERDILKAEIKSLTDDRFKKNSTSIETIQYIYFSESGQKMTADEDVYTQEYDWINRFIQRELGSSGLLMDCGYIRNLLEQEITNVFISADMKDIPVTVERVKQLQSLLQKAS